MSDLPSESVLKKIQGLLDHAAKNENEGERSNAAALAQKLLTQYNLTAEAVADARPEDGRREEARIESGFYEYQQAVWREVAAMNFCVAWRQHVRGKAMRYRWRDRISGEKGPREMVSVLKVQMVVVGRIVNVRATKAMATYLLAAIERTVREQIAGTDVQRQSRWAVSFRRGCADRIARRLRDQRSADLAEERKRQWAADRASRGDVSTSRAVSIASLRASEYDANIDFVMGEGWSARQAAARAAEAAERREREEAHTKWAAENPEEAAAEAAKSRKGRREPRGRRDRSDDNVDYSAYYAGSDAAEKIGLHAQLDEGRGSKIGGA